MKYKTMKKTTVEHMISTVIPENAARKWLTCIYIFMKYEKVYTHKQYIRQEERWTLTFPFWDQLLRYNHMKFIRGLPRRTDFIINRKIIRMVTELQEQLRKTQA